jgi:putative DNA primase/helicase
MKTIRSSSSCHLFAWDISNSSLTPPGSAEQLVSYSFLDLIHKKIPEPRWLIEDILQGGGAAMIYGPGSIGKSFFVHTLVLMAARGKPEGASEIGTSILGQILECNTAPAKVLIFDGEMTEWDLRERTLQLCEILPFKDYADRDRTLANIQIYPKTCQPPQTCFIDIADTKNRLRIIQECQRRNIDILVLDNLSTLSASLEDENKATAWAPLNELITSLKAIGCATILVHHSGKGGSYRGSTSIITVLETVLCLEHPINPDLTFKGAQFRASDDPAKIKIRNSQEVFLIGKKMKLPVPAGDPSTPIEPWIIEEDEEASEVKTVRAAMTCKYRNQGELAHALGIDQSTVSRHIANFVKKKLKIRDHTGSWVTFKKEEIEEFFTSEAVSNPGQLPTTYDPQRSPEILLGLNLG